jgi:hypothetical protein
MRTSIFLSAALAAAVASPSFAEQWRSVWQHVDEADGHSYEVLLDESSIKASAQSKTRTATVKYVRTVPHTHGKPAERFAYSITSKSFQCDTRRTRLDHSEVHFPDGTLQYVDPRGDGAWHTPHDPASRQVVDIVCAAKTPKP